MQRVLTRTGCAGALPSTVTMSCTMFQSVLNVNVLLRCADEGHSYGARIATRQGFMTARLPFSVFRPENSMSPVDLEPGRIVSMGLRFDRTSRNASVILAEDEASA